MRQLLADLRGERRDPGARVLADVPPLVAMQDGGDEEPDGDRQHERVEADRAGHRVVRAGRHERPHQQEDERHAERPELVLERRRRVEVAAGQPDDAQHGDGPAAERDQGHADRGRRQERGEGHAERGALGDAALEDRVAGTRRGDRVDALPNVVDLVDDVRADVQEHGGHEGQQEQASVEESLGPGQCAARGDRGDRGRERKRPQHLPQRAAPAAEPRSEPELRVVLEPRPAGALWGGAGLHGGGRGDLLVVEAAPAFRRALRQTSVDGRGVHDRAELRLLLQHRLKERQLEAGVQVEGERARGDLLTGADEHERVEQLVGDEARRGVELLGAPGGGDPVAQLGLEAGALQ